MFTIMSLLRSAATVAASFVSSVLHLRSAAFCLPVASALTGIPPPSPLQIMRKGVLNDLERQTRAIERKTRDA